MEVQSNQAMWLKALTQSGCCRTIPDNQRPVISARHQALVVQSKPGIGAHSIMHAGRPYRRTRSQFPHLDGTIHASREEIPAIARESNSGQRYFKQFRVFHLAAGGINDPCDSAVAGNSDKAAVRAEFKIHDTTTKDRQGNDVGSSYRSEIFHTSDEQRQVAEDTIADVDASGIWPGKVVTQLSEAGPFWEAEPEHQDYLERIPWGYTCHFPRPNWRLPRRAEAQA